MLVEQEGEEFLADEEHVRAAARQSREVGDPAIVREAVRALPPDYQAKMLRAFALYFQLANAAEQHHRIRRRREDEHAGLVTRESLEEAFELLADVPEDELHERLARHLARAGAHRAPDRGDAAHAAPGARPDRRDAQRARRPDAARRASATAIDDRLAEEITVLWQTDEVRGERPRVIDEIRHGLWFFEESLFDAGEALFAAYRAPLPGRPSPVLVRHLDRRRPRRQPGGRRRDDRGRARSARASWRSAATGARSASSRSRSRPAAR